MPSLFEYNDGFRTLRKNFVTASKIRRLISLHEQFESIPMPNHWRNQAVAMAGLFSEREGGTPVITFYDHPAHDAHGETYTSLETALAAETAHGVDVAATLWTTIITNAETAIKVLRGAATTAAWNTDVMNWLDLWRMVNVPRGLPERPRTGMIRVNEFMVANRLKFSAIAAKHTPTGADKMGFYPKVSTDTEAVIRPWVGTPDEWWWSGMTDMLAWYAAGDSLGTLVGHKIGTLLPISAAPTEGADSSRWYTLEDGWQSQIWSDDMDDNAKIQAVLSAPDLKSHVWSTVPASLPGATNYADLDVSSYGSGYVGKVEQDLRDVADGFYKKMVLALEFAVA
jgi:hypothetical protein